MNNEPNYVERDRGDKLWRRLRRLVCRHAWMTEYLSFTKRLTCTRCGKQGPETCK